jgi:hypothetical protein
LKERRQTL